MLTEIHPIRPSGSFKGQIIPQGTTDTFTSPPTQITDTFSNIFNKTVGLDLKNLLISPVTTLKTKIAEKNIAAGTDPSTVIQKADETLQKVTGLSSAELNFGNPYQKIVSEETTDDEKKEGLKVAKVIEQVIATISTTQAVFKEVISSSNAKNALDDDDAQQKKQEAIDSISFDLIAKKMAETLEEEAGKITSENIETTPDNNMFTANTDGETASGIFSRF